MTEVTGLKISIDLKDKVALPVSQASKNQLITTYLFQSGMCCYYEVGRLFHKVTP